MRAHAERAPLHRNVDQLEVGGAALFPSQRPKQRHHRRNHVRRLRLQRHGVLERAAPKGRSASEQASSNNLPRLAPL